MCSVMVNYLFNAQNEQKRSVAQCNHNDFIYTVESERETVFRGVCETTTWDAAFHIRNPGFKA